MNSKLKKMAIVAICALLTASCAIKRQQQTINRQQQTNITAIVPDKAFRTWLIDNGYATRVIGRRLRPTAKGSSLTELSCHNQGIQSLDGIEIFPGLKSLVCGLNPIAHLHINGLPKLEKLYGIDMPIEKLDIDSCHNLTMIEFRYSHLSELKLDAFPKLNYLYCIFSPITKLDLSPAPT